MKRKAQVMSIEILQPELQQRVREKIQSGRFHDVDELLTKALDALEKEQDQTPKKPRKNLAQFLMESLFAGAELDLERRKQYMRPVEL
jgi:Arc/MetJ-type ribon-helix-helix transcriptional regulator